MPDHRILLQSNPTWLKTGLAENSKTLLKYLYKKGYDVAHYCTQGTPTNHPQLGFTPWKSFGCIPPDQNLINQLNADPNLARAASYGSVMIDQIVKDWKPTIWIGSDDCWSFSLADYAEKAWYQRINSIHHITLDSLPILDQAYEQAKRSKVYLTWAKFAAREMQRVGGASMAHVGSIYGAMDTDAFSPISPKERADLRRQFGIAEDAVVFLFVFRNQLRKSANTILEAYARFKAEHPNVKTYLHFHTSFSEKQMGWDIPKMMGFYGIPRDEVLCTYVCKHCGAWSVAPYMGEDLKCPACGHEKALVTANIMTGVPANQMKCIYGISDACLSIFTSGGQEYHSVQSLLCGKPLACTNYSCGEDFCVGETSDFVTPIKWHPYHEPQSNFIKAASDVGTITAFMRRFVRQPKSAVEAAGERARDWAIKTFGIETIGAQWEKLFATMPTNVEWSSVDVTKPARKNDGFGNPEIGNDVEWVKTLYREILIMDVKDDDSGLAHWLGKLKEGMPRAQIHAFFIQVAQQENQKNGYTVNQVDFTSLLDNTGRKRGLFVLKESAGDVAICTALFKSFHEANPDTDLYVGTDPKYADLLAGNEHVYKVVPYAPFMESELACIGQGLGQKLFDVYYHSAVQTQRVLGYLGRPEPMFEVNKVVTRHSEPVYVFTSPPLPSNGNEAPLTRIQTATLNP